MTHQKQGTESLPQESSNLRGDASSSPLVPSERAVEGPPHPFEHVILRPGEVLVLAYDKPLTADDAAAIRGQIPLELQGRVLAVNGAKVISAMHHDDVLRRVSDWLQTR